MYEEKMDSRILDQIGNLRKRLELTKNMQALGILSLLLCVICMFVLFAGYLRIGKFIFAISLALLIGSLFLSLLEIRISVHALNLQLQDLERQRNT